jgi:hypothetical protein
MAMPGSVLVDFHKALLTGSSRDVAQMVARASHPAQSAGNPTCSEDAKDIKNQVGNAGSTHVVLF